MERKHLVNKGLSVTLFLFAFLSYSLVFMTKNCYSAAMAAIVAEGEMTKSQTGLLTAVFYLFYAPFQIIGGLAADKISPHKLVALGTFGAAVANLLIYFTQNYVAMIIICAANAIIQFGIWPAIFKIISESLAPSHRVNAVCYIGLAPITGLLLSYALAVFISNWKNNFLISALILFPLALIFYFAYSGFDRQMIAENTSQKEENGEFEDKKHQPILKLLFKSGMPIIFVVYVIHNMLNLGIKAVAPVMLMESYKGVSVSLANAMNLILVAAGVLGVFIASIKAFGRISQPLLISAYLLLSLPFLFITAKVGEVNMTCVVVSMAVLMLILSASATYFLQMSKGFASYGCAGTVAGILNCMASVGILLSNYIFTRFSENYGWINTALMWLWLMAVALILCAAMIPIWKKFKKSA